MADTARGTGNTRPNTIAPEMPCGSGPGRWNPESGSGVPAPKSITRRTKVRAS